LILAIERKEITQPNNRFAVTLLFDCALSGSDLLPNAARRLHELASLSPLYPTKYALARGFTPG
jgi:hypothetical protein